jgi:hypothetical protein
MKDNELYDAFKDDEIKEYATEAKERWGDSEAYKQSMERVGKMTKQQMAKLKEGGRKFMQLLADTMKYGPKSTEFQKLVAEHYNSLRTFYEPNLELYRGLAEMYVTDERFKKNYDKYADGLAQCMKEAMLHYIETQKKNN